MPLHAAAPQLPGVISSRWVSYGDALRLEGKWRRSMGRSEEISRWSRFASATTALQCGVKLVSGVAL